MSDDTKPEMLTPSLMNKFFHRDAKLSKLATFEDKYHIHKTFGILSVCNFIYRYGYVFLKTGTLGYDGPTAHGGSHLTLDVLSMAVHTLLAFSSILFRVPRKRIDDKPMIIYEEYRQHAMVFTSRCFFVFLVAYFFPYPEWPSYLPATVVMLHHLLADRITAIHGTPNNTAVRATSARMNLSNFYKMVSKGYSFYQFLAIASHIAGKQEYLGDLAFNAIIAIQSSAFLMTLYRKRIITGKTHMAVYGFCLILSAFHIVRIIGWRMTLLTLAAFTVRINLPYELSNKYVIWAMFLAVVNHNSIDWDYLKKIVMEVPAVQGSVIAASMYITFCTERLLSPSKVSRVISTDSLSSMKSQVSNKSD